MGRGGPGALGTVTARTEKEPCFHWVLWHSQSSQKGAFTFWDLIAQEGTAGLHCDWECFSTPTF